MKLQLKDLAGYLPYSLNIRYIERNDTQILDCRNLNVICSVQSHLKPILRPLLYLTKEIEVNGEKFVPMVELLKLEYPTQEKIGRYSEIIVSEKGFPNAFYTYQANRCLTIYTSHIDGIPFWIIKKLLEWHFDIYGLIEKGLAIDINIL